MHYLRLRPVQLMLVIVIMVFGLLTTASNIQAQGFPDTFVSWNPDGTMLAVANDTTVQIQDVATRQLFNAFTGLQEQATAPAWDPDGTRLAIANGSEVQIWQQPWDASGAQLIAAFQSVPYISSMAWSPDGDRIAVVQDPLEVWDVSTAQRLYREYEHGNFILQVAWSPDGTQLATASVDKTVKIWDAATGAVLSTMRVMTDTTTMPLSQAFVAAISVAWSPDGTKLVHGAGDGTVRIWDREILNGTEVALGWDDPNMLQGHDDSVWAVAWSPDGSQIASGSLDGTVRIWDATTHEELRVIQVGTPVGSVAWSPDGSQLAYSGSENAVEIVPAPAYAPPVANAGPDQTVTDADSSGNEVVTLDGSASSDPDGQIVEQGGITLRALLMGDNCSVACVEGIEPGMDIGQLEARLSTQSIEYRIIDTGLAGISSIQYRIVIDIPTDMLNTNITAEQALISLDNENATIQQILVPLAVSVESIKDAFGIPQFLGEDDDSFTIGYPEVGLFFTVFRNNPGQSYWAMLRTPELSQEILEIMSAIQVCVDPIEICSLILAPPVASARPRSAPYSSRPASISAQTQEASILFIVRIGGRPVPYTMGFDGTNKQPLSDTFLESDQLWAIGADLSPDGRTLAFGSFDSSSEQSFLLTSADLFLMDLATSSVVRLPTENAGNYRPVWSPDGTELAYLANAEAQLLRVINTVTGETQHLLTGQTLIEITGTNGRITGFNWSPSGNQLAASVSLVGPEANSTIFLTGVDGTGIINVLPNDIDVFGTFPSWGNQEDLLYFVCHIPRNSDSPEICTIDLNTLQISQITNLANTFTDYYIANIDISRHNEMLIEIHDLASGRVDIYRYDTVSHSLRILTADLDNVVGYPRWVYPPAVPPVANAGPDQTVTDADSSGSEVVTLNGSASTDPDGQIVAYSWAENGVEIATGPTPTVALPLGAHTLTLTVTDDSGLTASDEVVITVVMAGGCVIPDPPLRDVFNSPTCQTPSCWLGIEPGITTQSEVQQMLSSLGVDYTVNPASYPPTGPGEEGGIYNFLPDDNWPYIYTEGHYLVWMHFVDGIVGLTQIPVEIPLQSILAEYGAPKHVMDTGNVALLVYPTERMAFAVSFANPDTVKGVAIGTEKTVRDFFLYEDASTHPLTDCSVVDSPCPIPTATPLPTLPTAAAGPDQTVTDADSSGSEE